MQVTINIPDRIAVEAAAHGLSVDAYVEEVLAKQAQEIARPQSAAEAVDRIRSLRLGVTMGDLKIKDILHEGHRY